MIEIENDVNAINKELYKFEQIQWTKPKIL